MIFVDDHFTLLNFCRSIIPSLSSAFKFTFNVVSVNAREADQTHESVLWYRARVRVRTVHAHKKHVDVCPLLLKTDTMNAFNTLSSKRIVDALIQCGFGGLLPLVQYGNDRLQPTDLMNPPCS